MTPTAAGREAAVTGGANPGLRLTSRRIRQLGRPFRTLATGTAGLGLAVTATRIAQALLVARILGHVLYGRGAVGPSIVAIAVLGVARLGLIWGRDRRATRAVATVGDALRAQLLERLIDLGPGYLARHRTGAVETAVVADVDRLAAYYGDLVPFALASVVGVAAVLMWVLLLDPWTGLVMLAAALLVPLAPVLSARAFGDAGRRLSEAAGRTASEYLDAIQGLLTLKAFGAEARWGDRLAGQSRELSADATSLAGLASMQVGFVSLGLAAGTVLGVALATVRATHHLVAGSTLLAILLLARECFRPLGERPDALPSAYQAVSGANAVVDLLDAPVAAGEPAEPVIVDREALAASVSFEEVTFAYGDDRPAALERVSFDVAPGETVALVGPSGAGKSTVVALLLRFFDPQEGTVRVGGHDVSRLARTDLRALIAVAFQDTYLFGCTVRENLLLARPGAGQAEIEAAARQANAHDFITALPHGYETVVGERGSRLSGGERQRLAIARALLADAPILVLDEPTSSVDAASERLITEALDRLRPGRTTIVIAHHLSTIRGADRVIAFDSGHVTERGQTAEDAWEVDATPEAAGPRKVDAVREIGATAPAPATAGPAVAAPRRRGTGAVSAVVALAGPWRRDLRYGIASGLLQQVLFLAGVSVAGYVAGRAALGAPYRDLELYLLGLVVIVVLQVRTPWLEAVSLRAIADRVEAALRPRIFDALGRLTPAGLAGRRSGELGAIAMADVEVIHRFFAETLSTLVVAAVVPVVALVAMALLSWPLALLLLPFLTVAAAVPVARHDGTGGMGAARQGENAERSADVVDIVQGLREIVAFGDGRAVRAGSGGSGGSGGSVSAGQAGERRRAGSARLVPELLATVGGLAVLGAGAALVRHGRLSPALLPPAVVLAFVSFGPVSRLVAATRSLGQVAGAGQRIFALLATPVPVVDPAVEVRAPAPARSPVPPGVEFRDVRFRYRPDLPLAIDGVSFTAGPGQTVALAGHSGAGKSTCINLLLRFWALESGRIAVGGADVRDLPLPELHASVGLVAQDVYLFNTTIRDNLRLGRPDATDEEIEHAARAALAWEFVRALPEGLDTWTGERGVQLSGGQRQRIAVARAFLADPPVLVLDEPVAHLDRDNERALTEAIARLRQGRTTLIVAHRLSTLRIADRIVVLAHGRVAEEGTHAELLGRDGAYRALLGP